MSWLLVIGLKNAILALPLAALALVVTRWARRPALAHLLWAVVLVKLLTPPLVDVPVGWQLDVERWLGFGVGAARTNETQTALAHPDRERIAAKSHRTAPRSVANSPSSRKSSPSKHHARKVQDAVASSPTLPSWLWSQVTWPTLAGIVWAGGSFMIVAVLVLRAYRFRRFLWLSVQCDEHLAPRVGELAHIVGLRIPPKVIVVDGIVSPMLWGLGQNATLIFPGQLARRLSPNNLDALLLHELAHYARGDHWIRALELAAFVVYWWNPLVWWARREIEAVEEECCDAWVVEHQRGTRHSYAEALLTTIDFLCERPRLMPPVFCGLGEVEVLRVRLTQIMRGPTAVGLSRSLQIAVIAAGVIVSPLEPALWATSSVPRPRAERWKPFEDSTRNTVTAPVRRLNDKVPANSTAASSRALPAKSLPAPVTTDSLIVPAPPSPPTPVHWATATSSNGRYRLEARTGRKTTLVSIDGFRLDLSAHQIRCAAFAPDSRAFATGHENGLVRLWESESGGIQTSLRGSQAAITSVQFSSDGRQVAAGALDGSVLVWDRESGDVAAQLPPQPAAVSCLRWSKRGDRLAVTLGDWSQREEASLLIWSPQESVIVYEQPLAEPAGALDWLADDEALVIASWSGQAAVWSVSAGFQTEQLLLEKDRISAAAWSPDCPLVSRSSGGFAGGGE